VAPSTPTTWSRTGAEARHVVGPERLIDHVFGVGDRIDLRVGGVIDHDAERELGGKMDRSQDVGRGVGGQAADLGVAQENPMRDISRGPGGDKPDGERTDGDVTEVLDHGANLKLLAPGERILRDDDTGRGQVGSRPLGRAGQRSRIDPDRSLVEAQPLGGDLRIDRLGEEVAILHDRDRELRGPLKCRRLDRRQGHLLDHVDGLERRDRGHGDRADRYVVKAARAAPERRQDDPGPSGR